MRVLIDADIFAYQCGFVTQSKGPDGNVLAEPVENALHLVKTSLKVIQRDVDVWMDQSGEKCQGLELFLTGKGNFREEIATIKKYKDNRKGKAKPIHYQAIRDYMVNHWGAVVVDGHEADDQLAIEACKEDYNPDRIMLVSCDKDLKTIPGALYDFKKQWGFLISEQEALANFYRQMITGDSADNILGVYKQGPKAAAVLQEDWPESKMWDYCLELFDLSLGQKCPYAYPREAAIETGRLLHLLREPGQIWTPPDER